MTLPFNNSVAQCTPAYGSPSNYGSSSLPLASGAGAAVSAQLGSAAAYSLLAGSGITNTGATVISGGNVGSSPTATITGLTGANFTAPAAIDNTHAGAAKTALTAAISYYQGLVPAALTLTAAANAVGGNTTYTGTITGGAANGLVGSPLAVTGFSTGGNHATGLVTASTATTVTIANSGGVAETHAGSASFQALSNLSTGGNGGTAATYLPGNYFSVNASSLTMPSGIILDAQGNANATFVFVAGSTINLASGQTIALVNGAQAANVVFVVGSSFTSVATSTVNGNILAATSITLGGGTLNGRALASSGAVTIAAAETITTAASGISPLAIASATKLSPTAVTVTVGAPGTTSYVFALIANFADGTVSPATYVAVPNGAAGATTYAFAFTAAAGATSYSIYSVGAVGATTGTLVVAGTTANPYTSGSITPAAGTTIIPSSLAFNTNGGPAPSRGMIHLRTSGVSGSTTTTVVFTVSDGTSTVQVGDIATTAAGSVVDKTIEFNTDLWITIINAVITLGGATYAAVVDWEVSLV